MQLDFIKPGTSSNVYDLGFKFAIKFNSRPADWTQFVERLSLKYGEPAGRHLYYNSYKGLVLKKAKTDPSFEHRWFVGPKHWGASKQLHALRRAEHWMVFRTEKDRLVASMMI